MGVRSGITAKTPERIFIDAGAVYLNYGVSGQRLLGATRGGNEFNPNRVIKNIEADGIKGSVKGMKRVTEVNPQITANLLELTVDNLIAAIAGANRSDWINVVGEAVGIGNGSATEFPLDYKPVLENSEKIYVENVDGAMILQTRSKKYASGFVGSDAVNNKGFVDGLGTWVAGHEGDTLTLVSGGQHENCLRFTAGGTPALGFLTLDDAEGVVLTNLVEGAHYRLQIAMKQGAAWNGGIVTIGYDGKTKDVTTTTSWVVTVIEFIASATGDATITLTAASAISPNDVFYIDSLELEQVDGEYVMNWIEGKVIFTTAPGSTYDITANYTYTSAAANETTITGGEIGDEDYIDNVAIVGNVSGKTYPVICIVKNALADAGFSISTAPRDEAVPVIVFTGHYDPDDLDNEPWEIRYPKT